MKRWSSVMEKGNAQEAKYLRLKICELLNSDERWMSKPHLVEQVQVYGRALMALESRSHIKRFVSVKIRYPDGTFRKAETLTEAANILGCAVCTARKALRTGEFVYGERLKGIKLEVIPK